MTPLPRGTCPDCRVNVALRRGGLVRTHFLAGGRICKGSGLVSAELACPSCGGRPHGWRDFSEVPCASCGGSGRKP